KAAKLCAIPEDFQRKLIEESAWGFIRGTAENAVSTGLSNSINQGVGASGVTAGAIAGATSIAVGVSDPLPTDAAQFSVIREEPSATRCKTVWSERRSETLEICQSSPRHLCRRPLRARLLVIEASNYGLRNLYLEKRICRTIRRRCIVAHKF
ncbi:MAG: hypothetical protein AAF585_18920, partial [Verrucomicrobiota bacterium]